MYTNAMANTTIYIRRRNQELWDSIPNKSDFLNSVLRQLDMQQKAKAKNNERVQNEETNAKTNTDTKEAPVQKG